jgi:hypothetical protein
MGFRVSAVELAGRQPVADYETRAATAEMAHAEAQRLGVEIVELLPLDAPDEPPADTAPDLAEWQAKTMVWIVRRWSLVRLGFEHPTWGKWLYRPVVFGALLLKTKVALKLFAAAVVSMLAMIGVSAHPAGITFALALVMVLGPFLLIKPLVFRELQRMHARAGFDRRHRIEVRDDGLLHFDGVDEYVLDPDRIVSVHELPHFVLIGTRSRREIAIPKAAIHPSVHARRFAIALARAAGIAAQLDFRSEWVGERRQDTPAERFRNAMIFFALGAVILLCAAVLISL